MSTEYDVQARLTMDARQASKEAARYGRNLKTLGQQIQGTQSSMTGLITKAVGVGTAYMALQTGVRVFANLTKGAIQYTAALETSRIGLASVLSVVEGISYQAGKKEAVKAFEVIKDMAVESPAGPAELFDIFQGIIGPIRAAGVGMKTVYDMTENTVLAAAALNVDLPQARRDIALMARGTAGMDTRMFSILTSMGLIKETTEEWNKKLTAKERVERLDKVLKGFSESGDDFAKSFSGARQVFAGIVDEFKRALITPAMDRYTAKLVKLNDYLSKNSDQIIQNLTEYGNTAATTLENAFDRGVDGFKLIKSHWGDITDRWDESMDTLGRYGPLLAKVAAGVAIANMARGPLGAAVEGAGMAYGALPGLKKGAGAVGGMFAGAGGAAAAYTKGQVGELKDLFFGGQKQPFSKGVMSSFEPVTSAVPLLGAGSAIVPATAAASTGAAVAGAEAGAGTAAATAAATGIALGPIVIALLALSGIAVAAYANFDLFVAVFRDLLWFSGPLIEHFKELGKNLWSGLRPILEMVGLLITATFIPAWKLLVSIFDTLLMPILLELSGLFKWIGELIENYVNPALRLFIQTISDIKDESNGGPSNYDDYKRAGGDVRAMQFLDAEAEPDVKRNKTPEARSSTTINVDKMIIKQEFKGDKDPDRILSIMLHDITKQAERRVSTRWTGALTR